jgi:hypothetical protein
MLLSKHFIGFLSSGTAYSVPWWPANPVAKPERTPRRSDHGGDQGDEPTDGEVGLSSVRV